MHLFYTPDISSELYTLSESESRHAVRVLRLRQGDTLYLTDGVGTLYTGELTECDPRQCSVRIVDRQENYGKRPYSLCMAVAPTKNPDRYEWFLEKATEVGCDRFVPLLTERSERRVFKHERAERVITSAVKQSLKAYHPVLDPLTGFSELVERPFDGVKLIAHCESGQARRLIRDVVEHGQLALVLIGPEGDLTPAEIELATKNGFQQISLGDSRLRTETAALAAVMNIAFINQ